MTSFATVAPSNCWVRAIALAPVIILIVLYVMAPGFLDPLYADPPGLLGQPGGVYLLGLAAVLGLLGAIAVWRTDSPTVRVLAIALLTIPALLLIALGPTMILAIQGWS